MMKKMVNLVLGLSTFLLLPIANAEFTPKFGASANFIGFRTHNADANLLDQTSTTPPTDILAAPVGGGTGSTVDSIEVEAKLYGEAALTKTTNVYLSVLATGPVQAAAHGNVNAGLTGPGAGAATNAQAIAIMLQEGWLSFKDNGFDVSFGIQSGKTGTFGRNYWHGINFGFNPDKGGAAATLFVPNITTGLAVNPIVRWVSAPGHVNAYRHVNATTNAVPSVQASYGFGEIGKEDFNGKLQAYYAYPGSNLAGPTRGEVSFKGVYGGVGYGFSDSIGINLDASVSRYANYQTAAANTTGGTGAAAGISQPDIANNVAAGLQLLVDVTSDIALTAGAMFDKSDGQDALALVNRDGSMYTAVIGGDFKNLCLGDKLFCLGSTGVFWQDTLDGGGVAAFQAGRTNKLARLADISHLHAEIEHSWLWRYATAFYSDRRAGHFGNGSRAYAKVDGSLDVGHAFDWGVMAEQGKHKTALTVGSNNLGWGLTSSLGTKLGPVKLAFVGSWFDAGPAISTDLSNVASYMLTVGF